MINLFPKLTSSKKDNDIVIGKVKGSFLGKEVLTEQELNHHVHIVGATGYGKTVLLSNIVQAQIEQGKGLIFIDLKGELETLQTFRRAMAQTNRLQDLQVFSLSDQSICFPYNLLNDGTPTQLRDRIMIALNWSEEYYKNQSASYLLKFLIGLVYLRDIKKKPFHLGTIFQGITSAQFVDLLTREIPDEEEKAKGALKECARLIRQEDFRASLQGLRTQIESLILSDFGESITSNEDGINLFNAIKEAKIIFIFLDSRRYGETAKSVGRFILQDLKATSARIDAEVPRELRKPVSVIIDEFADLATEDFIGLIDRARSSKMSLVLAHQEIRDLFRVSLEFGARLMGNASTLYAFLQKGPDSAELISKIAGTRSVRLQTEQYERVFFIPVPTGKVSVREAESYIIHPNVIKSLRVGECVAIKKYPSSRAHLIQVRSGGD